MINQVKIQGDSFLVDGTMSVPQAEGNRHYQEVLDWIAEGNTPEPEFTQFELDVSAQELINQESIAYLTSTEWYVIRLQETGVAVPQGILDLRASARLDVV
jgi:hypothetical protein